MKSRPRTLLFLCIAVSAGMVAQELMSRLSAAKETSQLAAGRSLTWTTPEAFYGAHCLSLAATAADEMAGKRLAAPS